MQSRRKSYIIKRIYKILSILCGGKKMKEKRVVIAIGGNALLDPKGGKDSSLQLEKAKELAVSIIDIAEMGYEVVIVHGNGPQVGQIYAAHEKYQPNTMPLKECTSMSQGYVGYHLQYAITYESMKRKLDYQGVSLVTHVEVDPMDEHFKNPDKPIGFTVSQEEAKHLNETYGYTMREEITGGFRHVVASPRPIKIIEMDAIGHLVDQGFIVIAAGGGGIPVVKEGNGTYKGVDAVIDKDFAAEKLGIELDAEYLLLITGVERVAMNFGKPNQIYMDSLTSKEADLLASQGEFEAGSILPKVNASCNFVNSKKGRKAIITSVENCKKALKGEAGTVFVQ